MARSGSSTSLLGFLAQLTPPQKKTRTTRQFEFLELETCSFPEPGNCARIRRSSSFPEVGIQ